MLKGVAEFAQQITVSYDRLHGVEHIGTSDCDDTTIPSFSINNMNFWGLIKLSSKIEKKAKIKPIKN